MSEEKTPLVRYWRVPKARLAEGGLFIGGAWFPFVNGIVATPIDGDYSWALTGFAEVEGPQIPGADAPAEVVHGVAEDATKPSVSAADPTAAV